MTSKKTDGIVDSTIAGINANFPLHLRREGDQITMAATGLWSLAALLTADLESEEPVASLEDQVVAKMRAEHDAGVEWIGAWAIVIDGVEPIAKRQAIAKLIDAGAVLRQGEGKGTTYRLKR